MKRFVRVMKAFADPSRVKIIKLLGVRELCVCELRQLLGLAQPTVSKHLKILQEAGLVDFRKEGAWIIYRLSTGEESIYAKAMLHNIRDWLDDEPQIRELVASLPLINRERTCAA